jgi:hypothetical protein
MKRSRHHRRGRAKHPIVAGLTRLGPHLVPDYDSETGDGIEEFAHKTCACCGSRLAGGYHRFAVLG